jgi:hypothetical protein
VREFLYLFPSLGYFLQIDEILTVFFYTMAFALLESILVTGLLVLLSMVLPERWFRNGFSYKGFLAILITSVESIWLQMNVTNIFPASIILYGNVFILFAVFIILAILFSKIAFLQRLALATIDRVSIMIYVYVPLGLLSLIVVFLRNI